LQVIK